MRVATIDLGTNTFNLLIAEVVSDNDYNILFENKLPSKIGKGGINNNTLLPEAIERGLSVLKIHKNTIEKYNVEKTVCIATSAIRNATNGNEFALEVKKHLGFNLNIISGIKEAKMIFDGIKQVVPIGSDKVMILDIGGGSNEFIIANKDGIIWKHSFELGMARLLDRFNPSNPIIKDEIDTVENYLRNELYLLFEVLKQHEVTTLIGSSGAFDTIAGMLALHKSPNILMSKIVTYKIDYNDFIQLHIKLLNSTIEQRLKMERMESFRVEMIVLASIFINFIVRECQIINIWQCSFSLKEGAIYQIMKGELN